MIKIFKGKNDTEVLLELKKVGGNVQVIAVDLAGKTIKSLLIIRSNGTCGRFIGAEMDGIQTDEEGRILLDES